MAAALVAPAAGPDPALAQEASRGDPRPTTPLPSVNLYGTTGLIDMPSAEPQPDAELNATVSTFAGITRSTLTFQVLPRVSGSFRYTGTQDLNFGGFQDYYDRSFDLRLLLLREREGAPWPSVTLGFQDFIGTGLYSGEYLVATKTLPGRIKVTGGLGWGRLGSANDIGSPFGDRPPIDVGLGGGIDADVFFRGPVAPFGGIEWQATDRLGFKLEYSSDAYELETRQGVFERSSSVNAGVEYRLDDAIRLGAYYLHGSEVGASLQFALNPGRPPLPGSIEPAPPAVLRRPPPGADGYATAWTAQPAAVAALRGAVAEALSDQGIALEAFAAGPSAVEVRVLNTRFDATAQAIGRTARVLSRTAPPSVETFRIVPVSEEGLPLSAVTVRRSDLEDLVIAPDGTEALQAAAGLSAAGPTPAGAIAPDRYPRLTYGLGPYTRFSFFDPDEPLRYEVGARAAAELQIAPGLVASGSVTKAVISTIDDIDRDVESGLPRVRTDFPRYAREGDPALERLTLAYYFKPGENLYGRVSAGYLERMFGGVSTEVLWKRVGSPLALGVEIDYARKRDFDQGLGFQDYDVVTGHASAYYSFANGFDAQIDAGRYLAGDWGATFTLARSFDNGWRVGAYATVTDATAEEFGEGSFDKGISLSIPLSWFSGRPTLRSFDTTISPLTRDGGARLSVEGRLYERVAPYHQDRLDDGWGRLLR